MFTVYEASYLADNWKGCAASFATQLVLFLAKVTSAGGADEINKLARIADRAVHANIDNRAASHLQAVLRMSIWFRICI
jgi:hypothetical protein